MGVEIGHFLLWRQFIVHDRISNLEFNEVGEDNEGNKFNKNK